MFLVSGLRWVSQEGVRGVVGPALPRAPAASCSGSPTTVLGTLLLLVPISLCSPAHGLPATRPASSDSILRPLPWPRAALGLAGRHWAFESLSLAPAGCGRQVLGISPPST